ncbi:MAG: glycosyl hydrolase 53 family protein, partial [Bacteroidales bacterium]|nr:glycosyl hydrolase 53 family protein [Bacteroidales bacterium]
VWVDPDGKWCAKDDVVAKAKRAKGKNLDLMIDFHYSDFFADPGRQLTPSSWEGLSLDKTAEKVKDHTKEILSSLKDNGITPKWVQVGNETNNGMIWDTGKIDWDKSGSARYKSYVTVSNAGYDAVKSIFPDAIVVVHIANAYNAGDYDGWFFKEFKEAGGKFDMIGLSHYPMGIKDKSWKNANDEAISSIKTLAAKQSCKVMICEVGVKVSQLSEATSCMSDFMQKAKALKECAGVFYWEPEVYGGWKPAIYKDVSKYVQGEKEWNAYDMGAFSSDGSPSSILNAFKK